MSDFNPTTAKVPRLVSNAYYSDISSSSDFEDEEVVDTAKLEATSSPDKEVLHLSQESVQDGQKQEDIADSEEVAEVLPVDEDKPKPLAVFICPWATEEEFLKHCETVPEIVGRYTDADPVFRDDKDLKTPPVKVLFRKKIDQRHDKEAGGRARGHHVQRGRGAQNSAPHYNKHPNERQFQSRGRNHPYKRWNGGARRGWNGRYQSQRGNGHKNSGGPWINSNQTRHQPKTQNSQDGHSQWNRSDHQTRQDQEWDWNEKPSGNKNLWNDPKTSPIDENQKKREAHGNNQVDPNQWEDWNSGTEDATSTYRQDGQSAENNQDIQKKPQSNQWEWGEDDDQDKNVKNKKLISDQHLQDENEKSDLQQKTSNDLWKSPEDEKQPDSTQNEARENEANPPDDEYDGIWF